MLEDIQERYPAADFERLLAAYRHLTGVADMTLETVLEAVAADGARNNGDLRLGLTRAAKFTQEVERAQEIETAGDPLFVDEPA